MVVPLLSGIHDTTHDECHVFILFWLIVAIAHPEHSNLQEESRIHPLLNHHLPNAGNT